MKREVPGVDAAVMTTESPGNGTLRAEMSIEWFMTLELTSVATTIL